MTCRPVIVFTAALVLASPAARSEPTQTTKYVYYGVSGKSAAELHRAMMRSGPRVDGAQAYASTSATASQSGNLVQGSSCRVNDFRVKLEFTIKLPKLRNEAKLPSLDRSRWKPFAQFLKRHEETHRSIWLGCARTLEKQARQVTAKTCAQVERKLDEIWNKVRKSCDAKQDAFDRAERSRLERQPFIVLALQPKRKTSTQAASTP